MCFSYFLQLYRKFLKFLNVCRLYFPFILLKIRRKSSLLPMHHVFKSEEMTFRLGPLAFTRLNVARVKVSRFFFSSRTEPRFSLWMLHSKQRFLREQLIRFNQGPVSDIIAQLITYFGNFVFGFFVTLVAWFSLQYFLFARQDRQDKMKIQQTITKYFCNFVAKNNKK